MPRPMPLVHILTIQSTGHSTVHSITLNLFIPLVFWHHNKTNHFLVSLSISVTTELTADPFEFTYPSRHLSKTITHHYLLSLTFQMPPVIFTLAVSAVHSIMSFIQLKYFKSHTNYTNAGTLAERTMVEQHAVLL
jgi:hypothetical protein